MNRRTLLVSAGSVAVVGAGALVLGRNFLASDSGQQAALKLGWQPPWANQGQIVEVLKQLSAGGTIHYPVEFLPFTFGGPMTEAALAGRVDGIFLGDQPALKLISKDAGWRIVSRLVNYRSAFVIPPASSIRSVADLRGKTVAT